MTTTRQEAQPQIIYVQGVTQPHHIVAALSKTDLDDVITGKVRINADRSQDLAIWNAAIDRDNGYL